MEIHWQNNSLANGTWVWTVSTRDLKKARSYTPGWPTYGKLFHNSGVRIMKMELKKKKKKEGRHWIKFIATRDYIAHDDAWFRLGHCTSRLLCAASLLLCLQVVQYVSSRNSGTRKGKFRNTGVTLIQYSAGARLNLVRNMFDFTNLFCQPNPAM